MAVRNSADPARYAEAVIEAFDPGERVWDVGAYRGGYALAAAAAGARVRAFEPDPTNYDALVSATRDAGVVTHRLALADAPGYAQLRRGESTDPSTWRLGPVDGGRTPVVTVDGLVADGFVPPDVLKVDVEGAEARVLAGAAETLRRFAPTVFVEVHERAVDADAVARPLHAAGYAVERLDAAHDLQFWRATAGD